MAEYTRFTDLEVTGEIKGLVKNVLAAVALSKAADYTLKDDEKVPYIGITMTAASKTVTLGLPDSTVAIVVNEGGTNAFTLKNVSGDSGTSLAAGKLAIIKASKTANGSKVYILN